MTKAEKAKCKQLADEALVKLNDSEEEYEKYEKCKKKGNMTDAHIALRDADQDWGYAQGIYQALVVIGYRGKEMEELSEKI